MPMLYDISLPIRPGMITYPGNPEVAFEPVNRLPVAGGNLTRVTLGTHTGTHIDSPNHVFQDGRPIDRMPLEAFFGSARVLDLTRCPRSVGVEDFQPLRIERGQRLLLKTPNSIRGFDQFYDDYVFLDGDAAEWLAGIGIALVGIDSLSIKQRGGSDKRPHTALLAKGIPILEGINLRDVPPGEYTLSALPLRLVGLDGAPCRAVLWA